MSKISLTARSSQPEVFCEKVVLKNFAKFTRKHECQSIFLIKARSRGLQLFKKETLAQMFSCKFCEIFKSTLFHRTPLGAASVQHISFHKTRKEKEKMITLKKLQNVVLDQCKE